jgi:hypothetical protein
MADHAFVVGFSQAMTAMRRIFIAHDFDVRYDDPAIKTRVINVYFPFILTAIDHRPSEDASHIEQREFLICLLFLLKNVDANLLQQWWRKETATRLGGLFDILSTAVKIFEVCRVAGMPTILCLLGTDSNTPPHVR